MPRTIVCGIDRSSESLAAARLAGALGRRLGWRLELVHVCRPRARPQTGVVAAAQRVARNELDLERVDVLVESGPVHERLAEAARDAELLVVGARGESALRQTLFGSVTASLTRTPSCPVVVVPAGAASQADAAPLHGRTIACGVRDHHDLPCAQTAAHLASELGLSFTAMHVRTPARVPAVTAAGAVPLPLPGPPTEPEEFPAGLREGLRVAIASAIHRPAEIRVLSGTPGPELARAANEESAAMVAVGASDCSPLAAAFAGTPSRHLVRNGDRPVLVCPASRASAA